jgi:hypothetical protein
MIPRSISVFDLKRVPGAVRIIQNADKEEIDELLWQIGFDPKLGYELNPCLHRPLTAKTNEPVYGIRVEGYERFDPEWLQSENASWDAKVENIDPSLRDDLISMGQQSNFTNSIIEHISGGQKGEEG